MVAWGLEWGRVEWAVTANGHGIYLGVMKMFRNQVVVMVAYRGGNGTPLQYSCLENPMDGGAWWAAAHGVAKSRT